GELRTSAPLRLTSYNVCLWRGSLPGRESRNGDRSTIASEDTTSESFLKIIMPFPTRLLVLPIVAALLATSQTDPSAKGGGQHRAAFRDGVALVAFLPDATPEQRAKALTDAGAVEMRVIGKGARVVRVPPGHVMQAVEFLKNAAVVRYAEPDFQQSVSGVPNDPNFSQQWALLNTGQTVNGVAGTSGAD